MMRRIYLFLAVTFIQVASSTYQRLLAAIKTSTFDCNSQTLRQEIDARRLKQSQSPSVPQPGIISSSSEGANATLEKKKKKRDSFY